MLLFVDQCYKYDNVLNVLVVIIVGWLWVIGIGGSCLFVWMIMCYWFTNRMDHYSVRFVVDQLNNWNDKSLFFFFVDVIGELIRLTKSYLWLISVNCIGQCFSISVSWLMFVIKLLSACEFLEGYLKPIHRSPAPTASPWWHFLGPTAQKTTRRSDLGDNWNCFSCGWETSHSPNEYVWGCYSPNFSMFGLKRVLNKV